MTKNIRIENADTTEHKVVVEVWERGKPITSPTGEILSYEPGTLHSTMDLSYPTQMITQVIYKERYLVIKEV